jgi:acyl-CoA hydrolase
MPITELRTPSASAVETTHLVLPGDTNAHGTAFGGRIMQWMDIAAGIAAERHSASGVVTAAVDEMVFERPIRMGDIVVVKSCVNYTGRSSMEVGVRVEREERGTRHREHALSAYFTFVSVGRDGKPQPVPPVQPQTEIERRRYAAAEKRRQLRLAHKSGA